MIDATALRKQAANKYPEVVETLLRGGNPFPLKLRYPHIKTTASRDDILRDIATLKAESREQLGHGLTITWTEVDTVRYGRNAMPNDIHLSTEDDYLGYIDKREEMRTIRIAAEALLEAFPGLHDQLPGLWRSFREGDREFWQQVVRVIEFFRSTPFPDCYVRELPIEVHTKFIEKNRGLLEKLVEIAAPHARRPDGETFEERLGLKSPDSLIECRLLDDNLFAEWRFRQFTIGLKDFEYLNDFSAHTILITENRTNFLTLPPIAGVVAIQGQGYAVTRLRHALFLKTKRILYWGDIDTHGFEILALLRREYPQVESIMMDAHTFSHFQKYQQDVAPSRNPLEQYVPYLNQLEVDLFKFLSENNKRLEQEQITQIYANKIFAEILS